MIFFPKRRPTDGERPSQIYIRVSVNGKRYDWATGRKCYKDDWDRVTHRVKGNKAEVKAINAWLDALYAKAHACRQDLYLSGKTYGPLHIRKLMQGEELERPKMLSEVWSYHTAYIAGLIGKGYSQATLQKYNSGYKALKKFMQLKFQSDDIRLDKLDHQFVKEYEFYLKTAYGVKNNTAIQIIKKLRTMMRIAIDLGWLLRDPFIAHRMSKDEVHRNYLTSEELKRLQIKKLTGDRLRVSRDLFLFSCFTGLSFQDTTRLSKSDVITGEDGEQWIQTHRVKNNNRVRVPILPPALAIINRYTEHPQRPVEKLFPPITNQRANADLKKIAKRVKIDKYLTYHCARHTFATTVTLTNGVPIETVGQMLGHKNIRSTQIYARVTDTKVHQDMFKLKEKYSVVD